MRIGIIQPNYIPWRGYFDFIAEVDRFVLYDDVKYTKNDWRNRNRIKTAAGSVWLTVPVNYRHLNQRIDETEIDYRRDWVTSHLNQFRDSYRRAPHFEDAMAILRAGLATGARTIDALNASLIADVCAYLGITTPIVRSSTLAIPGGRNERLIAIIRHLGGTEYLSGPSAQAYLDAAAFRDQGIALAYKRYDYAPYAQLWGPYVGEVSVLDLIANCGPGARGLLQSAGGP